MANDEEKQAFLNSIQAWLYRNHTNARWSVFLQSWIWRKYLRTF